MTTNPHILRVSTDAIETLKSDVGLYAQRLLSYQDSDFEWDLSEVLHDLRTRKEFDKDSWRAVTDAIGTMSADDLLSIQIKDLVDGLPSEMTEGQYDLRDAVAFHAMEDVRLKFAELLLPAMNGDRRPLTESLNKGHDVQSPENYKVERVDLRDLRQGDTVKLASGKIETYDKNYLKDDRFMGPTYKGQRYSHGIEKVYFMVPRPGGGVFHR